MILVPDFKYLSVVAGAWRNEGAVVQISFGDYRLDIDRRELTCGAELISIGPQVFDLLVYLVQHRDHVVSKEGMIEGVWGGRIVSDRR